MTGEPTCADGIAASANTSGTSSSADATATIDMREALKSALRALDPDSMPIVRRLARIQIRAALQAAQHRQEDVAGVHHE